MVRPFWLKLTCHQQHDVLSFAVALVCGQQCTQVKLQLCRWLPDALWQAFVAIYSWRPRRRPQVIGSAPFTRGIGCPRKSSTTRWQSIISGTSLPCGIDLQLSKRVQHTKGGGDWNSWRESSPCGPQAMENQAVVKAAPSPSSSERKMKI